MQAARTVLAAMGAHPASGAQVQLLAGRYGPYVTDGTTNASLPKGADPAKLTMEEARRTAEGAAKASRRRRQGGARGRTAGRGGARKPTARKKVAATS